MLSRHFDVNIYEKINSIGRKSKWSKLDDTYVDFRLYVLKYGEEIAAGASISVYEEIMKREGYLF